MSKTTREASHDLAALDERFSGLTDMEIRLLDEALASLDVSRLGLDEYQVFTDLKTSVEIQLNERNCDLEDIFAHASGQPVH